MKMTRMEVVTMKRNIHHNQARVRRRRRRRRKRGRMPM
jgi:hypothetical protein